MSAHGVEIGLLILRVVTGLVWCGHGTQKLFGWFGGGGVDATADAFEHMGLHPARRNAIAAGAAETTGGALMFAGLATPLASSALTATMLTAIRRVHLANGPWISKGGYEYNLVLISAVLALAEDGPGRPSLDAALGIERRGTRWALAAAAAGALGAVGAHKLAEREAARLQQAQQDAPHGAGIADRQPAASAGAAPNGSSSTEPEPAPASDAEHDPASGERLSS